MDGEIFEITKVGALTMSLIIRLTQEGAKFGRMFAGVGVRAIAEQNKGLHSSAYPPPSPSALSRAAGEGTRMLAPGLS
jgi:hypothetical protein